MIRDGSSQIRLPSKYQRLDEVTVSNIVSRIALVRPWVFTLNVHFFLRGPFIRDLREKGLSENIHPCPPYNFSMYTNGYKLLQYVMITRKKVCI